MWQQPLIVTGVLASLATLIAVALYKRSESLVQNKWARFSGAAAIAVAAFIGMTRFYLQLAASTQSEALRSMERFDAARAQFDLCLEQERAFACRDQATALRNQCAEFVAAERARQ
jgi:hypothetical protein